jgi:hypothetical protein
MPPRGYRIPHEVIEFDDEISYKRARARGREAKARRKAAFGKERQLRHLVDIAILIERDGLSANAAAGEIANQIGGNPRIRHANHKTLYGKFQRAPALYRRLALAGEDPSESAMREFCEEIVRTHSGPLPDWVSDWVSRYLPYP